MFAPANLMHFALDIPGVTHDFQVLAFSGREALNKPYAFVLDVVSERFEFDLQGLLGRPAYLAFDAHGHGRHGLILAAAQGESGRRLTRYQITLGPQLDYLRHRHNQCIFKRRSVPAILAGILEAHGILASAYRFQLNGSDLARDYCVQY